MKVEAARDSDQLIHSDLLNLEVPTNGPVLDWHHALTDYLDKGTFPKGKEESRQLRKQAAQPDQQRAISSDG